MLIFLHVLYCILSVLDRSVLDLGGLELIIKGRGGGCALFYKPIWELTVNERGYYADSEDTFLFKIDSSPAQLLGN